MREKHDMGNADALARVSAVIDAFEHSDWEEVRLDTGQVAIHLSTSSVPHLPEAPEEER